MLDIKFLRDNPEIVKQNIKNKFQDSKLPLVDEVIALDAENRAIMAEADALRGNRNKLSKQIGALMGQGKKEEAEEIKKQVTDMAEELEALSLKETQLEEEIRDSLDGVTELVFDFAELAYVSSAGLRVLLSSQKTMNGKGTMVVKNVSDEIQEIFDVTGFSDILTIE